MPIFANWSSGVHKELDFVVNIFDGIDPFDPQHRMALETFRAALTAPFPEPHHDRRLDDPRQLITALVRLADATVGWEAVFDATKEEHETLTFDPVGVHRSWFSMTDSMWRFDSELSPHQIHLIMRATGAEMARLLLDEGRKPSRMMTQCNHPRMKSEFFLEGDDRYSVWIFVPTNSGWMTPDDGGQPKPDEVIERELIALAADHPLGAGYGKDTENRRLLINDILAVVSRARASCLPFEHPKVPFNWGGGYQSPAPDGGVTPAPVVYVGGRRQPGDDQLPKASADPAKRTGPEGPSGEIGWGKGDDDAVERKVVDLVALDHPIRTSKRPIRPDLVESLHRVQANILRPHGRAVVNYLILTVTDPGLTREYLAGLHLSTAGTELGEVAPELVRTCAISRTGLEKLIEVGLREPPATAGRAHTSFDAGFHATRTGFCDTQLAPSVDLMITVAGNEDGPVGDETEAIVAALNGRSEVTVVRGQRLAGQGSREPFGFVEGISGPRFFGFDVRDADQWFEGAAPKTVLVRHGEGYGSFLVFQKLKQDAEALGRAVSKLGKTRQALMGRTEDGDLVHRRDLEPGTKPNDFRWPPDDGAESAFKPHIQLMNPRDPDTVPIARRSVPYRDDDVGEEGLLFAAYTSSIHEHFEPVERDGRRAGDVFVPGEHTEVVTCMGGEYLYVPPPGYFAEVDQIDGAA